MRLHHVVSQLLRRLQRRYAFLRRFTVTTTLITLIWLYAIHWGERSVYNGNIDACEWKKWETWPQGVTPHHLVFIADPQLVDPHTYPGRVWPLSTLTERYTDLYMARNFRLINENLDPDSVIFLGDLFDGGREWAPDTAKPLNRDQLQRLEDMGVRKVKEEKQKRTLDDGGSPSNEQRHERRDDGYSRPHGHYLTDEEHNVGTQGEDLRLFTPGEDGRWSKWGNKQWLTDLDRFSKIFFTPEQLYPVPSRRLLAAYNVPTDPVSIENGARGHAWQEFATTGGKQRKVISSLPGNHDLGFGPGVQLAIRDRFESHFGDGNRVDVVGNHTIISLDVLSMAAHSYFADNGYEVDHEPQELIHIWKPGMEFLETMRDPVTKKISEALGEYYPRVHQSRGWQHEVTDTMAISKQSSTDAPVEEPAKIAPELPIMVLSHVPLFRLPDSECGKLRERGHAIRIAMGYQYQNVLTQTLSKDIITKISDIGDIVGVFTGDDHDYCDITHRYNIAEDSENLVKTKIKHIREITVKSFSWAMGVRKPGFLQVSMWNPVDAQGNTVSTMPLPTLQTHLCLLPDQLNIFLDYGLLFGLTVVILVLRAIVLSLRQHGNVEEEPNSPVSMSLPRFRLNSNGAPPSPTKSESKLQGRARGASTSTATHSRDNSGLGVQRSYNARTRSVSPAPGFNNGSQPTAAGVPLIEKAGYFPQVKWIDPADDDPDEESHVGDAGQEDDSQAKWKWRRRTKIPNKARKALQELVVSISIVGVPCGLWYAFLVKNG